MQMPGPVLALRQIVKVDEVRRKEVGRQLAPQAVDAENAGPHDGVDYQALHRADHPGG